MKLVQCWDDGPTDDIRLIEILRAHGAKGTFNLNMAIYKEERSFGGRFREVKDVYKLSRGELLDVYQGFLVGNHTISHPHLTQVPAAEAAKNIQEGRDALEQHFGYPVTGFAYPYGDFDEDVMKLVAEVGQIYARTCVNVANCYPPANPMAFHPNCHFLAPDFWERFEASKAANDPVFYFWGHSFEIMDEAGWAEFDAQIARLTADPETEWVDLPELFA